VVMDVNRWKIAERDRIAVRRCSSGQQKFVYGSSQCHEEGWSWIAKIEAEASSSDRSTQNDGGDCLT
jgi:hypothetical protein